MNSRSLNCNKFISAAFAIVLIACISVAADEKAKPSEGRILVQNEGKTLFLSPEGKTLGELPAHPDKAIPMEPAVSPDGRHVAYIVFEKPSQDREGNFKRHVHVIELDAKKEGTKIELTAQNLAWTPDGKLLVCEAASFKDLRDRKFTAWLIDIARNDKTRLDLPEQAQPFGITADGKSILVETFDPTAKKTYLSLLSQDGKTTTQLSELSPRTPGLYKSPRLSPDGSCVLFTTTDRDEKLEKGMLRFPRLFVHDLKSNKNERVSEVPLDALILGYAWSPDSKRIAYAWKRMEPGVPMALNLNNLDNPKLRTETESFLSVAEATGKNPKTILSAKSPIGPGITISSVDWR